MTEVKPRVANINPADIDAVVTYGAALAPLEPIGAVIRDLPLSGRKPPLKVVEAIERTMATRGFVVFKSPTPLPTDAFLEASCWWGGQELHSTHGVHPATPGGNAHLFRLSNDPSEGIRGVGPQWHNDGSFNPDTFSHAGYHMVRAPEQGGGTCFAHQASAFDALTKREQQHWGRLSSVNSASGVVHPLVHRHPFTGLRCVWLHLGMTGAVIEKLPHADAFRLLNTEELTGLCLAYNALLDAGVKDGYALQYEYENNDCLFIDNLAVAHRAAPQAHLPRETQGLRIMHRSTVRGVDWLKPDFGLPMRLNIYGPSPLGDGVWQPGGVGFRWDEAAAMQN